MKKKMVKNAKRGQSVCFASSFGNRLNKIPAMHPSKATLALKN